MELVDHDKEILKLRMEYDRAAYTAQMFDAKRKLAEIEKMKVAHYQKLTEMENKILQIEIEMQGL